MTLFLDRPRARLRVVSHVLRLTFRADPTIATVVMAIVVARTGSTAIIALAQRWLVQGTGPGVTAALALAVVSGALAQTIASGIGRIQGALRWDLIERVDVSLNEEILTQTALLPSVEHLEHSAYLDRLNALRRGTMDLAASGSSLLETLSAVLSLAISVILLVDVHPSLIIIAALGVLPLVVARRTERTVRRVIDSSTETIRHEQTLHDLFVRAESAKETRISGSGTYLTELADREWQDNTQREVAARIQAALWQLAGWCCYVVGFGVAIVVVTWLGGSGRATLGDVMLVIVLGTGLRHQISVTVNGFTRLGAAAHVTDHYLWLRDYGQRYRHSGMAVLPERLTEGITLDGVGFRYDGAASDTLRDLTLHFPAGSVIGLVGPNGAGKSTLIKLLTGLYPPVDGRILVDGIDLRHVEPVNWSTRTSGAFQDFVEFELTAGDAIGIGDLPRHTDAVRVHQAAGRGGADEVVAGLADGYATQLGSTFGGVDLSPGQWQRLALARGVMAERPLLLVLDEPTAALDPQAEHNLFERFTTLARAAALASGTITILVSHRFSTVTMTDRIVVLDGGRVVEHGTHRELLDAHGGYARMFRLQARGYS